MEPKEQHDSRKVWVLRNKRLLQRRKIFSHYFLNTISRKWEIMSALKFSLCSVLMLFLSVCFLAPCGRKCVKVYATAVFLKHYSIFGTYSTAFVICWCQTSCVNFKLFFSFFCILWHLRPHSWVGLGKSSLSQGYSFSYLKGKSWCLVADQSFLILHMQMWYIRCPLPNLHKVSLDVFRNAFF